MKRKWKFLIKAIWIENENWLFRWIVCTSMDIFCYWVSSSFGSVFFAFFVARGNNVGVVICGLEIMKDVGWERLNHWGRDVKNISHWERILKSQLMALSVVYSQFFWSFQRKQVWLVAPVIYFGVFANLNLHQVSCRALAFILIGNYIGKSFIYIML